MKKLMKILLVLILVFSLTGCKDSTKEELTDAEKFKQEYESLNNTTREKDNKKIREVTIPEDNPMVYSTAEEIAEKMDNKESFIVYFGFNDCPWCRSVIEQLIKVANDRKVSKIYYVDVKDIRDVKEINEEGKIETTKEGTEGYYELIEKMSNVLDDYTLTNDKNESISAEEKRIFAPNVVAVSRGKAIELESGISEEQTDPYQDLTEKAQTETYKKFECIIKCLEETSTTCQKNVC